MQWHQLDHMQTICTLLQTDNHINNSSLNFLQAGCTSWRPTNSVKALKDTCVRRKCGYIQRYGYFPVKLNVFFRKFSTMKI